MGGGGSVGNWCGAPMGRVTRLHRTPGITSTSRSGTAWAAWKARMLAKARSKAARTAGSSSGSGSSCGPRVCEGASRGGRPHGGGGGRAATGSSARGGAAPSNRAVSSATASSPRVRTASTSGRTWGAASGRPRGREGAARCGRAVSRIAEKSTRGRCSSAAFSAGDSASSVYVRSITGGAEATAAVRGGLAAEAPHRVPRQPLRTGQWAAPGQLRSIESAVGCLPASCLAGGNQTGKPFENRIYSRPTKNQQPNYRFFVPAGLSFPACTAACKA